MAARNRRQKRRLIKLTWAIIVIIIGTVGAYFVKDYIGGTGPEPVSGNEVQFHFIDVGQGDAALIRTAEFDVLIDAGPGSNEDDLKAYLDKHGVDDIEYAIFTHPDEDHIGGADVILENYNVKNVIQPDCVVETKVYQRMVELIDAEGSVQITAEPGYQFRVGEVKYTILAPIGETYSSRNNYSVVVRVDYGETSVLFTGDAEKPSEEEMLDRYRFTGELDCDIIKVGHHGSDSSSTEAFVKAVTPDFAIISCGKDNKHGHPDQSVVSRYQGMSIPMYRTDLEGDIVFTTTGGEPEKKAA